VNPFAPPQTDVLHGPPAAGGRAFTVEGRTLVVRRDELLPQLCIWSGEPTSEPRTPTKLYWAPTWTVIFVISPLIYILVYLIARKSAYVSFAVGPEARERRRQGLIAGFVGLPASLALFFIGASLNAPLLMLISPIAFLVVLVFAMVRARVTHVIRIDREHVHFRLRKPAADAFARAT
jgi:hypothetical protein